MSSCRACRGQGWYWVQDGDCVAKEICDCEAGRRG